MFLKILGNAQNAQITKGFSLDKSGLWNYDIQRHLLRLQHIFHSQQGGGEI